MENFLEECIAELGLAVRQNRLGVNARQNNVKNIFGAANYLKKLNF